MQINKVNVNYLDNNKKYTFDAGDLNLKIGDYVVVDTIHGLEIAVVASKPELCEDDGRYEIKSVVRKATDEDLNKIKENAIKRQKIKKQTQAIVERSKLDMKVVSVELNLDCSKIIISFTAEERVDFRELVKELAGTFKARIELRQIGSRDETKVLGGLGPCGRPVCCNQFLSDCEHASIKMAKNQNLSLNPTKISGLCGKLMCCLSYENDAYLEIQKRMPKINSEVTTPDGKGIAIYNDLLKEVVNVRLTKDDTVEIKTYPLDQIQINKYSAE